MGIFSAFASAAANSSIEQIFDGIEAISKQNSKPEKKVDREPEQKTTEHVERKLVPSVKGSLKLAELHEENMSEFIAHLYKHRLWYLMPTGESNTLKSNGLLDTQTGLLYPTAALRAFLKQHSFVYVQSLQCKKLATLHSTTRLLWNNEGCSDIAAQATKNQPATSWNGALSSLASALQGHRVTIKDGKQLVEKSRWAGLDGWRLPNKKTLNFFATDNQNPHREGRQYWLTTSRGENSGLWLTVSGGCNVAESDWSINPDSAGHIFAFHSLLEGASDAVLLSNLALREWRLQTPSGEIFQPDGYFQNTSLQALPKIWRDAGVHLQAFENEGLTLDPRDFLASGLTADVDYTPCRLPKLTNTQLTDPDKGLWELWGTDTAELKNMGLTARDPMRDVQHRAVAIDFGTSSTVVAMDTASGARELLRIGVRDFYQPVKPAHFENPTMLECLDFQAFADAWGTEAYRPALDWDWMRAAHEAQAIFRDNPGDTNILSSILPRLKQWALRETHQRVRLTDRQGHELELESHTERNPVRGQALAVSSTDPFDPIELYAWYLGMAINWRGRGLFLKYYLSFPVKYQREVKERILASFRRGLQRSLPSTLIEHHPQVLNDFEVNDLASEPAAYAAAALRHLGVQPSDEGVPYAVFDFGGGTTDFDFGLLRWATEEEEDQGYERVFEHLASSGDNYLGGENLLEHLVYESFQHNLDELRQKRIQFTLPFKANPFSGSEAFLASTQAAQTNTVMLAAKLRPFMESDTPELLSQLKLDLIDADGKKTTCELLLDVEALDALLAQRMRGGVEAFLAELAKLRTELPANAPIQMLLAGNGSRSRHITALFDDKGTLWQPLLTQAFGESPPEIVVRRPLRMDDANPHAPTTKTGVALGLLRLVPGENTLLKNHVQARHEGQAPFAWSVGRLRRDVFAPALLPGATYGEWQELGPLQQGVFNLFFTTSPRAHTKDGLSEGHPELKKHRMDFPAAPTGARLFGRAMGPHALELAAATDISALDGDTVITPLLLE